MSEEAKIQAFAAAKGLDPEVVRAQLRALRTQEYAEDVMYYSRIRFIADVAVAPPISTYTVAQCELAAFSYGVNGVIPQGGTIAVPAGINATFSDTNLVKASETNGGEDVKIKGISFRIGGDSDPLLWAFIANACSVRLRQDNKDRYLIGAAADVPNLSALPHGISALLTPPTDSSFTVWTPPENNVMLYPQGYMPFTRPITWTHAGETDSNLAIMLQLHRPVAVNAEARETSELCPCHVEYNPPKKGEYGTFCDVWVRLHGTLSAPRSVNQ